MNLEAILVLFALFGITASFSLFFMLLSIAAMLRANRSSEVGSFWLALACVLQVAAAYLAAVLIQRVA